LISSHHIDKLTKKGKVLLNFALLLNLSKTY
jgi:hypothetical protein